MVATAESELSEVRSTVTDLAPVTYRNAESGVNARRFGNGIGMVFTTALLTASIFDKELDPWLQT